MIVLLLGTFEVVVWSCILSLIGDVESQVIESLLIQIDILEGFYMYDMFVSGLEHGDDG